MRGPTRTSPELRQTGHTIRPDAPQRSSLDCSPARLVDKTNATLAVRCFCGAPHFECVMNVNLMSPSATVVVERSHPHTASLCGACASYAAAVIYIYVENAVDEQFGGSTKWHCTCVCCVYVPEMWLLDFGFGPITSWRNANIGFKFEHPLPTLKQIINVCSGRFPGTAAKNTWAILNSIRLRRVVCV